MTPPAGAGDAWVADGNYGQVRDLIWPRAEMLVWLDYPLPLVLTRLARRTLRRVAAREVLWQGNRETLRSQFFSRDSLFVWALKSHPRHRREYPRLLRAPEQRHLRVVRLRSPRRLQAWVDALCAAHRGASPLEEREKPGSA